MEMISHSLRVQSERNLQRSPWSTVSSIPWCAYCGRKFRGGFRSERDTTRTRDHIVPADLIRTRPNTGGAENIAEVCYGCNFSKKNTLWIAWLLEHPLMRRATP